MENQIASKLSYLHCHECGKQVSSGFYPIPTEMGEGIVVRAWIQCPECIEKEMTEDEDDEAAT